jgi:hypothetical protein
MRTRTALIFTAGLFVATALGYWAGQSRGRHRWPADGSPWPVGLTLAKVLRERGVSPESVTHFRFVGDESSRTSGRVAVDTNATWIWERMLETAEPYSFWVSSGYRRVEIYIRGSTQPAAILFVNETDATNLEGDSRRFMCHGLSDFAVHLLTQTQRQQTP